MMIFRLMPSPLVLLLSLFALTGCNKEQAATESAAKLTAEPFGAAECAACGMVVSEQPSPRAQIVHRDGHHAHFCSVSDMLSYHDAPSPHGKPAAVFIETLAADARAAVLDKALRPWAPAAKLHYVVGIKRPNTMGAPVLAFESAAAAAASAKREGGRVADWATLKKASTK